MVVLARYSEPTSTGIDVGVIYASSAAKVRRLVRHTVRAPDPLIDDACQTAWTRLIRDRERVRAPDAVVGWLVTTAVREALKLTRRAARELFLEELLDETGELHELAGGPGAGGAGGRPGAGGHRRRPSAPGVAPAASGATATPRLAPSARLDLHRDVRAHGRHPADHRPPTRTRPPRNRSRRRAQRGVMQSN